MMSSRIIALPWLLAPLLLLLPPSAHANMASPWVAGSTHSALYGSKDCDVTSEQISVELRPTDGGDFLADFRVDYRIQAPRAGELPLVFIGEDLFRRGRVIVNGADITEVSWGCENRHALRYTQEDSVRIDPEDLVSFRAPLRQGLNRVVVSYAARAETYRYDFVPKYQWDYNLFPSRFWRSFGPITVRLHIPEGYELATTPYISREYMGDDGVYVMEDDILEPAEGQFASAEGQLNPGDSLLQYEIQSKDVSRLNFAIKRRVQGFPALLLSLTPFGLAAIALLLLFALHLLLLREAYRSGARRHRRWVFWLGGILVPLAFYGVYLLAFPLITWAVGSSGQTHGYYLLFLLTWPVLQVLYLVLVALIGRFVLRRRYPPAV